MEINATASLLDDAFSNPMMTRPHFLLLNPPFPKWGAGEKQPSALRKRLSLQL